MDSILFDAYNTCKPHVFESLISDDIEFYHVKGGLTTSKKDLVQAFKNNICGKVTRELLKGSIEVYRIPNYGAVQMGFHRFYKTRKKSRVYRGSPNLCIYGKGKIVSGNLPVLSACIKSIPVKPE